MYYICAIGSSQESDECFSMVYMLMWTWKSMSLVFVFWLLVCNIFAQLACQINRKTSPSLLIWLCGWKSMPFVFILWWLVCGIFVQLAFQANRQISRSHFICSCGCGNPCHYYLYLRSSNVVNLFHRLVKLK